MEEENECYRLNEDGQTADLKNKNIILGFVSEISFSPKGPTMTESTREIEIGAVKGKDTMWVEKTNSPKTCGVISRKAHCHLHTCLSLGNTFQTFDL